MANTYPNHPGTKGEGITRQTSEAAAHAMSQPAGMLRMVALATLARLGEATPLECVSSTNLPRESLQPRFSELRRMGLVEPTGARRRNPSGKGAAVLRLTAKGKEALRGPI
jgi:DNA-binding MarR family transcriptional regulator